MSKSQHGIAQMAVTDHGPGSDRRGGTPAGADTSRPGASRTVRRTEVTVTVAALGAVLLAVAAVTSTGTMGQFLTWAWERHANVLSWYVRPLFVLPLALFSYRRSPSGIVLTLVALATSMFWFPAPAQVDPMVAEFLAFEREWLTSGWTPGKMTQAVLAPVSLAVLCLVFWKRSLVLGLVVINAMALGKLAWGVIEGEGTGWAMQAPAVIGLALCDAGVLYAVRRVRRRPAHREARIGHPALEDSREG
jgi:hypothetical protein